MADAFVHGGIGQIRIDQIPEARGRAFWPLHEKELAANLYEESHPEVTVIRDWWTPDQNAEHLKKRARTPLAEPTLNMDPARALPELARRERELATLPLDHPDYEKQFKALTTLINDLERIIGRKPTQYTRGAVPRKREDEVPKELIEKLAAYKQLKPEKRRASILAGSNVELLALIANNETDPELQKLAIQRHEQVRSAS